MPKELPRHLLESALSQDAPLKTRAFLFGLVSQSLDLMAIAGTLLPTQHTLLSTIDLLLQLFRSMPLAAQVATAAYVIDIAAERLASEMGVTLEEVAAHE